MSLKDLLGIGIATERNDFINNKSEQVYEKDENGNLVLVEGEEDD